MWAERMKFFREHRDEMKIALNNIGKEYKGAKVYLPKMKQGCYDVGDILQFIVIHLVD